MIASPAFHPTPSMSVGILVFLPKVTVDIGVVSGKAIFGPPLDEYWKKKLEEEAAAKETDTSST
ncbi:hypothetical protein NC651_017635 [Populus alba x Populus x berolinensis]|nr:hypothetical protein NC651_017635 [Populus alba x Populus x berolinensis]